jgi:hypothetical protein
MGVVKHPVPRGDRLAYTVEDAIAAVRTAYADPQNPPNKLWWIQASITITDTPPEQLYAHPDPDFPTHITDEGVELGTEDLGAPITGKGRLWVPWWATDSLSNLGYYIDEYWYKESKFQVQRGPTGPLFLLGLAIEPVYAFVGSLPLRPPAFARSFVHRHILLRPKQYGGVLALQMQPRLTVPLREDAVNPKLTGTITPSPSVPGAIHAPAAIAVVLESLEGEIFDPPQ